LNVLKTILAPKLLAAAAAACMLFPAASQAATCEATSFYEFQYRGSEEVIVYWDVPQAQSVSTVLTDGYYYDSRGHYYYTWETRSYTCTDDGYWVANW
jgi:hypothetical protein